MKSEAEVFGKYLLGEMPGPKCVSLYNEALSKLNLLPVSAKDERSLSFVLRNPSCLGFIDASHALFNSRSLLRKKLHVMFAVLETQSEYAHLFLPERRKRNSLVYALWTGTRAVIKAVIGKLIFFFV
ncbi:MAG TPA: hypothetical protein VI112_18030 [Bacteroidia bacterium]|jgi:hypothetical protein